MDMDMYMNVFGLHCQDVQERVTVLGTTDREDMVDNDEEDGGNRERDANAMQMQETNFRTSRWRFTGRRRRGRLS